MLHTPTQGGTRGTPENLLDTVARLRPIGIPWEDLRVNVTSMGRTQLPMTTIAMAMGFNVRVGMEDNVLYRRGEPLRENAQLVERAVRIATELDRPIATPEQARELLRCAAANTAHPRLPRRCGHEAAALRLRGARPVAEAVELLAADGAQVLAGGQSLVPLMSARAIALARWSTSTGSPSSPGWTATAT